MSLPQWCLEHTFKEFLELMQFNQIGNEMNEITPTVEPTELVQEKPEHINVSALEELIALEGEVEVEGENVEV